MGYPCIYFARVFPVTGVHGPYAVLSLSSINSNTEKSSKRIIDNVKSKESYSFVLHPFKINQNVKFLSLKDHQVIQTRELKYYTKK